MKKAMKNLITHLKKNPIYIAISMFSILIIVGLISILSYIYHRNKNNAKSNTANNSSIAAPNENSNNGLLNLNSFTKAFSRINPDVLNYLLHAYTSIDINTIPEHNSMLFSDKYEQFHDKVKDKIDCFGKKNTNLLKRGEKYEDLWLTMLLYEILSQNIITIYKAWEKHIHSTLSSERYKALFSNKELLFKSLEDFINKEYKRAAKQNENLNLPNNRNFILNTNNEIKIAIMLTKSIIFGSDHIDHQIMDQMSYEVDPDSVKYYRGEFIYYETSPKKLHYDFQRFRHKAKSSAKYIGERIYNYTKYDLPLHISDDYIKKIKVEISDRFVLIAHKQYSILREKLGSKTNINNRLAFINFQTQWMHTVINDQEIGNMLANLFPEKKECDRFISQLAHDFIYLPNLWSELESLFHSFTNLYSKEILKIHNNISHEICINIFFASYEAVLSSILSNDIPDPRCLFLTDIDHNCNLNKEYLKKEMKSELWQIKSFCSEYTMGTAFDYTFNSQRRFEDEIMPNQIDEIKKLAFDFIVKDIKSKNVDDLHSHLVALSGGYDTTTPASKNTCLNKAEAHFQKESYSRKNT